MFGLNEREREVLELLAGGASEREIYLRLGLAESDIGPIWGALSEKLQYAVPTSLDEYEIARKYERAERQRLEAELWASEARLSALMDIAPEAILLANGRTGRILKANHQASVAFGYSPRELVGASVEMLVPHAIQHVHAAYRKGFLHSVRKREMGYHPPIQAVRKDGSTVEMDIALTASSSSDDVMVVCKLRTGVEESLMGKGVPGSHDSEVRDLP